jgi:hypothetical protein
MMKHSMLNYSKYTLNKLILYIYILILKKNNNNNITYISAKL